MDPIKQEAMFKIGCCYRQKNGQVRFLRVANWSNPDLAEAVQIIDGEIRLDLPIGWADGARRLSDGRYPAAASDEDCHCHLLPGEVDPQGSPIESPKHAGVQEKQDVLVQAVADLNPTPEPIRPPLTWADPKPTDRFPGFTVKKSFHRQYESSGYSPDLSPTGTRPDFICGSAHLIGGGK